MTNLDLQDSIDLSRFDAAFAAAQLDEPWKTVPEGIYDAIIENVEIKRTRTTGNPMICWTLRIEGPSEFAGLRVWKRRVITENTVRWVKIDLAKCGVEMKSMSDLWHHLEDMLNLRMRIAKRVQNGNEEISFLNGISNGASVMDDNELPF